MGGYPNRNWATKKQEEHYEDFWLSFVTLEGKVQTSTALESVESGTQIRAKLRSRRQYLEMINA